MSALADMGFFMSKNQHLFSYSWTTSLRIIGLPFEDRVLIEVALRWWHALSNLVLFLAEFSLLTHT
jgi:hypothetical protein